MSRTFQVRTTQDRNLIISDFMDNVKNFIPLNKVTIKVFHDGKLVNTDEFDKVSLNQGLTCFKIDDDYIFVNFKYLNGNLWWIESRALCGIGRSFFVGATSAIANLTDGLASSGDGAWHNCEQYHGSELWSEYLSTELDSY